MSNDRRQHIHELLAMHRRQFEAAIKPLIDELAKIESMRTMVEVPTSWLAGEDMPMGTLVVFDPATGRVRKSQYPAEGFAASDVKAGQALSVDRGTGAVWPR